VIGEYDAVQPDGTGMFLSFVLNVNDYGQALSAIEASVLVLLRLLHGCLQCRGALLRGRQWLRTTATHDGLQSLFLVSSKLAERPNGGAESSTVKFKFKCTFDRLPSVVVNIVQNPAQSRTT